MATFKYFFIFILIGPIPISLSKYLRMCFFNMTNNWSRFPKKMCVENYSYFKFTRSKALNVLVYITFTTRYQLHTWYSSLSQCCFLLDDVRIKSMSRFSGDTKWDLVVFFQCGSHYKNIFWLSCGSLYDSKMGKNDADKKKLKLVS